jgi:hypothetical protein
MSFYRPNLDAVTLTRLAEARTPSPVKGEDR